MLTKFFNVRALTMSVIAVFWQAPSFNDAASIQNRRFPMSNLLIKIKKLSFLSLPLCFLSFVLLDFSFQYFYGFVGETDLFAWQPLWFTLFWSLLLTALISLLPRLLRRIVMLVLQIFFSVLVLVHAGMYSVFGNFFSFRKLKICRRRRCVFQLELYTYPKAFDRMCAYCTFTDDSSCVSGPKV